jgi:hypothetical protein
MATFHTSFSLGGGTGAGVGSSIVTSLRDSYPKRYIVSLCVTGSGHGDVACQSINSVLAGSVLQVCLRIYMKDVKIYLYLGSRCVPLAGLQCAVSPGPRLRLFRPVSRPVCGFGVSGSASLCVA